VRGGAKKKKETKPLGDFGEGKVPESSWRTLPSGERAGGDFESEYLLRTSVPSKRPKGGRKWPKVRRWKCSLFLGESEPNNG